MRFLFDDPSFSFEAIRAASYAGCAGADLGETIVTCARIEDGDEVAWQSEWAMLAERIEEIGRDALAAGHPVSAREALLRASNYYRVADFYYRHDPDGDPERSLGLARRSQAAFADAVPLLETPGRAVRVPYEDTTLPGYFYAVDDSGAPRPTVVFHGGYDSTLEELYFACAAGALRRGYNVLTWDGPGQGSNVRDQHLFFRPDWETTVTPAVDLALSLPDVADDKLVLIGMSLGGYFAPRAAAFERRLAACVAYDGVWNFQNAIAGLLARAEDLDGGIEELMANETIVRWAIRCGLWSFGLETPEELERATAAYTMDGIAGEIRCPTLVLDAENDEFFKGQPRTLYDALTCRKDFIFFSESEGAGEHCSEGAPLLFHQRTFDWIDDVLAA